MDTDNGSTSHDEVHDARSGVFWMHDRILDVYAQPLGPYGLSVYVLLCRRANKNHESHPAVKRIAHDLGISDSQAKRELKKLRDLGLIKVEARRKANRQTSNVYTILDPPAKPKVKVQSVSEDPGTQGSVRPPKEDTIKEGSNTPTECVSGLAHTDAQELTKRLHEGLKDIYNIRLSRDEYSTKIGQFDDVLAKDEPTEREIERMLSWMLTEWKKKQRTPKEAIDAVRLGRDTGEAWSGPAPWDKKQAQPSGSVKEGYEWLFD